ncbi:unnamed protein product, partial [Adineta steineri]
MGTNKTNEALNAFNSKIFYHGTKADLKHGDFIQPGFNSNYEAAIWGAELAQGEGKERIYLVEPSGPIEDDPNLTNKKFPGNLTKSYRSLHAFIVVGEV